MAGFHGNRKCKFSCLKNDKIVMEMSWKSSIRTGNKKAFSLTEIEEARWLFSHNFSRIVVEWELFITYFIA